MKFVVTGGLGFIGSHFAQMAIDQGHDVHIIDKLTYAGMKENIADIPNHKFTLDILDIADFDSLRNSIDGFGSDAIVVNFAAESHVDRSISNGRPFIDSNIVGVSNLLELLKSGLFKKLLQVSTDEVYGTIDEGSWDESSPLLPRSPYSASKASAELLCQAYRTTFQLDIKVTRCANNYGPRQSLEKLIPNAISKLLEGKPIELYGDGANVREWIYVKDHASTLLKLLLTPTQYPTYNIGGNSISNRQLAESLISLVDPESGKFVFVKDRPGHDFRYSVDDSRIRNEIGDLESNSFENHLMETINWYKINPDWIRASAERLRT